MADWLKQYTEALEARDVREQAHKPYIDAYTRLTERFDGAARRATTTNPASAAATEELSTLRNDLATTQRARAAITTTLKDVEIQLTQLQAERQRNVAQIAVLTKAKLDMDRKLKDRDDELRGKARLVEHAQDEMVALGLQLHVSEEKSDKLTKENKELVDRWMKRMEAEADKVNRDSRWS